MDGALIWPVRPWSDMAAVSHVNLSMGAQEPVQVVVNALERLTP
jgi:hypothetical protein